MPDRKYFYSELYLKDIPDKYYSHAQKVFEELKFKNLGDYHDWYVKSNTLLLADVFKKFRKKCIETYEIDAAHSLFCTWISMASLFNKDMRKIRIIN